MNNFQCFLVVLDGSNKDLVAVALVVKEDFNLSIDFVLSKFVPSDVVLGSDKFLFESDSVFLGCDEEFLVKVLNFGELGDGAKEKMILLSISYVAPINSSVSFFLSAAN